MSFDVGEIHPNTPHLFADLAELSLLVGDVGRTHLHKNDLEYLLNKESITTEEIDDEANAEQEADDTDLSTAERTDRLERQLEDVFTQLGYRASAFSDYYPFYVNGEQLILKDTFTERHRVYRLLLACSRLRSFGRGGLPQRWAKHFAKLSKIALEALVPIRAETRIFDANSDDRRNYYSTDLRHALRKMGQDLGVLFINEDECNNAGSSGDAGFDLISTIKFEDGAATNFALLGQCGAQEKGWPSKTLEAHAINLRHYFQIQFDYPSTMFTPVCYRTATGEWVDNRCANGILLADRGRILNLIEVQNQWTALVQLPWFNEFEQEFAAVTSN
ncbi:MAG: hypothetical protein PHF20_09730 [Halothiobacillaceae bacterium]|nr:hypothetical protein [Halothiobacillaceae bacterium]